MEVYAANGIKLTFVAFAVRKLTVLMVTVHRVSSQSPWRKPGNQPNVSLAYATDSVNCEELYKNNITKRAGDVGGQ